MWQSLKVHGSTAGNVPGTLSGALPRVDRKLVEKPERPLRDGETLTRKKSVITAKVKTLFFTYGGGSGTRSNGLTCGSICLPYVIRPSHTVKNTVILSTSDGTQTP